MKKKAVAAAVALGVLIAGGGGAYNILAGSAGYDAYKEAMKKTHTISSGSFEMEMSITDNGKLLLETDAAMKFDKDAELAQGVIESESGSGRLALQTFLQDGKPLIKPEAGETYFQVSSHHPKMKKKDGETFHDPEMLKLAELIMDAATRPVQDDFEQKGNTITVSMDREEFPEILNSIGKQIVKMGFKAHSDIELTPTEYPFLAEPFAAKLPKLEEEISIEKVYVKAELSEGGLLKSQNAVFAIEGKDEAGILHDIEVKMNLSISEAGDTKLQKANLEGKDIQVFEMKKVH